MPWHPKEIFWTFSIVEEAWKEVDEIGNGSFGDVWLQRCEERARAVKLLRESRMASLQIDYKRGIWFEVG